MVRDEWAMQELREQLAKIARVRRPVGLGTLQIEDADVDLWEEEAYFVGIADSVLHGHRVDRFALTLDDSIDARLQRAKAQAPTNTDLDALLAHRAQIRALQASLAKILRELPQR